MKNGGYELPSQIQVHAHIIETVRKFWDLIHVELDSLGFWRCDTAEMIFVGYSIETVVDLSMQYTTLKQKPI